MPKKKKLKYSIARIRYLEENGTLTSQPLLAETQLIMIRIDLKTMLCDIVADSGKMLVKRYRAKNRIHALKMMKSYAKSFGVKMYDEVRRRKNAIRNQKN